MSRLIIKALTSIVLMSLLGVACSPATSSVPVATPGDKARTEIVTAPSEWSKLVAEAKKEGTAVIATSNGPEFSAALSRAFLEKYGVSLEFIYGTSSELVPKIQAELRAGIYSADMFITGSTNVVPVLGPEKALQPLDTVLQLPEVLDKKAWWGGDLLWIGPNHFQVMFIAMPGQSLWINSDMVKMGEIRSHYDLLEPRWKGKISLRDPTTSGSGNTFFTFVAETLPNGLDYLRDLGKQEPTIIRDPRLQTEWVARGKYPVAIGCKIDIVKEFIQAGAPIGAVQLVEGTYVTGSGGGVALMSKAPHPKAAALFVNWLLSREGQAVASRAYGGQSARVDVPTDFFEPYEVRQAGAKYDNQVQQDEAIGSKYRKMAGEMYQSLLK